MKFVGLLFQPPTKRGGVSNIKESISRGDYRSVFQPPTKRGGVSNTYLKALERVDREKVSTPYEAGWGFQPNTVSHCDLCSQRDDVSTPYEAGWGFQQSKVSYRYFRSYIGFNPLRSGVGFPT